MRYATHRQEAALGSPPSPRPAPLRRLTLTVLVAAFALALLAPSSALAAFTRPFLHQITGTPSGPFAGFVRPGPVAVDAEDNLWVVGGQESGESKVSEFASSGAFIKTLSLATPFPSIESLAIDRTSGNLYVAGFKNNAGTVEVFSDEGVLLNSKFAGRTFEGGVHVAVDNSGGPFAGSVYVDREDNPSISRFNAAGEEVLFTDSSAPYVSGNQITGIPSEPFSSAGRPAALAVDSHGDIYVVDDGVHNQEEAGVEEFAPSGKFVQAFTGKETPSLGGSQQFGGYGGPPNGVAVDPVSGHVLVSVQGNTNASENKGAVDEFDSTTGKFLSQITETTKAHLLRHAGDMAVGPLGDLYVVSDSSAEKASEHAVNVYGPGHFLPSFEPADAGERTEHSALLNGSVEHETLPLSDCHFEYVTEAAFAANLANEVQTVTLAGATGGTFTLTFEGLTTAALPYNATAAEVQSALEGLSSIGSGNVAVTGPAGGPYAVEFKGSLAHTNVPVLSAGFLALTPLGASVTVVVMSAGDDGWVPAAGAPCVPAAGSIPADTSFHHVQAAIAGLTAGVTYRYRLAATTSGALGGTAFSPGLAFTAPAKPRVDSTSAENISSASADLHAQINPLGAETSYRFQYVSQQHFEQTGFSEPFSTPEVDVGAGGPTGAADVAVLAHIGGLAPGTVYRFRVLASNECEPSGHPGVKCATEGEAATFTTLSPVSPGLPDGRAYELVTPPEKGAAQDMFAGRNNANGVSLETDYPSESGNGFLLGHTGASFGPSPAAGGNAYVFSRTPGGWTYTSLAQPGLGLQSIGDGLADPSDFSRVAILDSLGSAVSAEGSRSAVLLGSPGGPYTTLHADAPIHELGANVVKGTSILGASHDLSHVVLQSVGHDLIAGGPAEAQDAGSEALYEYSAGELTPLNVNSSGSLLSRCGAILGLGEYPGLTHNAVSADGSHALITAPDPSMSEHGGGIGCWNSQAEEKEGAKPQFDPPQLYMRSGGQTVEVSAPRAGAPEAGAAHPASYVGASEDGSRVFFLSEGELTKDDAGIHDLELYEYDAEKPEGERLTRISAGESGKAAAGVEFVPAVSADGSTVYFTALASLTADAPVPGVETFNGSSFRNVDLYRYDTATGATTYVAMVNANDYPDQIAAKWGKHLADKGEGGELGLDTAANWYTTPDGRYLVFGSTAPTAQLTGGSSNREAPGSDCIAPNTQGNRNGHCAELYRYDSAAPSGARLACVSCNPSGELPTANAVFAFYQSGERDGSSLRPISDDGSYVFFESRDSLVPQDVNATSDVYEWRAGTVSLISSGQDPNPTGFLGTTPSGHDVFFATHARLVPQDTDRKGDVYDARIGGGFPVQGGKGPCEGNACENPPAAPVAATPATLTFASSGNLTPEAPPPTPKKTTKKTIRCAKSKKLSHGRCVKRHKKKSKRASIRRAR